MRVLTCSNGHPQARSDARFCQTCGAAIAVPSAANGVCVYGHPQIRAGAKFCYLDGTLVSLRPSQPFKSHPLHGVCAKGHPQLRPGAKFCYQCGAPVSPLGQPSRPVAHGPLINGRYVIKDELGRGGMGSVVYRVEDTQSLGREYALKEIDELELQPVSDRPKIIDAFRRESDLLKRLDHPNIIKAYDFFQLGHKYYMMMDLVAGRTLEKILETSPGGLPETRILPWAAQLCDTLDYLHHQNPPIIYRDMKPANVIVEDGTGLIRVIDFGIAREFKGGKKKGDTFKFGTEGYAPPEQYGTANTETSPASDVYALAAMLYHITSGDDPASHPFHFDLAQLQRPPVLASRRLVDALTRALDMDPKKRFQTMAEFSQAMTGHAPAKPKAPVKKAPARPRRPGSHTRSKQ